MHPLIAALAAPLLAILLGIGPARADARLDFTALAGDTPVDTVWLSGALLRVDGTGQTAIVDTTTSEVLLLDHASQTFARLDSAQMEALADLADAAVQGARQVIQWLPAEAREALGELGVEAGTPAPATRALRLQPTGQTQRIAGIDCQMHLLQAGGPDRLACLASSTALGLSDSDRRTVARAFALLHRLAARVSRWNISSLPLEDIDGTRLPVRIVEQDASGVILADTQLRRISSAPLEADTFAVPPGYTQQRGASQWLQPW